MATIFLWLSLVSFRLSLLPSYSQLRCLLPVHSLYWNTWLISRVSSKFALSDIAKIDFIPHCFKNLILPLNWHLAILVLPSLNCMWSLEILSPVCFYATSFPFSLIFGKTILTSDFFNIFSLKVCYFALCLRLLCKVEHLPSLNRCSGYLLLFLDETKKILPSGENFVLGN